MSEPYSGELWTGDLDLDPSEAGRCGWNTSGIDHPIAMCGGPATLHAWPGSPPDTRADFTIYACALHAPEVIASDEMWDWHPVASGDCMIPGAYWSVGHDGMQGTGRCRADL